MTADDVIDLRKMWDNHNYNSFLPVATVLASYDWTNYVLAMAEQIPRDVETIDYPSEEEVNWSWPEGVAIVFDQPPLITHTIISKQQYKWGKTIDTPPHPEDQRCAGLVFGIGQLMPTRIANGADPLTAKMWKGEDMYAIPIMWIGIDPEDIVTSQWVPGGAAIVMAEEKMISESTRFALALINALGHKLTKETAIFTRNRGEKRRVHRDLPSLRVLSLSSGASVRPQEGTGAVAWSKRWIVRGHWRLQPYGPERKLRRARWIDPYVKGPEDKPFDARPTIWRTE